MVLLASVIKNILILTPSKRNMSVGSPLHYTAVMGVPEILDFTM